MADTIFPRNVKKKLKNDPIFSMSDPPEKPSRDGGVIALFIKIKKFMLHQPF